MLKKGILLINLGTPDTPSTLSVAKYLREFLMDGYVVDIPWLARAALVHGIIVPFRSSKSAKAYKSIWTENGSPLRHYHHQFTQNVRSEIPSIPVSEGMRYGNPSIHKGLEELRSQGVQQIIIWPLYPQWAWASTASSIAKVKHDLKAMGWDPELKVIEDFFDHPEFIDAFVDRVRTEQKTFKSDYVLFSFHGIPERHLFKKNANYPCLKNGCCDRVGSTNRYCYRAQSYQTARKMAEKLGLTDGQWSVSFQSRLGRTPWIQPFTDGVIQELAKSGQSKNLMVVCPSFVADCLETLEEIAERERESFLHAGGADLRLVPSLNAGWAKAAKKILEPFL
jgi:ferrochelatase